MPTDQRDVARCFVPRRAPNWARAFRGLFVSAAIPLTVSTASCGDPIAPVVAAPDSVKIEWVAGQAAAALSPTGQFYFSFGAIAGEVDSAGAIALADTYLSSVILSPGSAQLRAGMEQLRQAPIAWSSLHRCRPIVRSAAVFGPAADSADPVFQRFIASKWIAPLCESSGAQSVVIEISARATNVHVVGTGLVYDTTSVVHGEELNAYPQPAHIAGLYLSPEFAVAAAFAFGGRRVSAVPAAVMRGTAGGALFVAAASRWRITLEDSVEVIAQPSGRRLFVRDLWLARDSTYQVAVFIPRIGQPTSVPMYKATGDPAAPPLSVIQVPVLQPVVFERVSRP